MRWLQQMLAIIVQISKDFHSQTTSRLQCKSIMSYLLGILVGSGSHELLWIAY